MSDQKVVVEERLAKPSMVPPTLFVGLGGAGCKIVRRVADHLHRRPDFNEKYAGLTKFAFVDTNINDLEEHRQVASDTFLISDFEKAEYSALAGGKGYLDADPYFTQWVPQNYRFRAGDTAGAGQIRIESRLGCYYQMKHKDFIARFRRLLEALKNHENGHRRLDTGEIRIVLAYSVAGGTGSGSHLPMAYMLRDLAAQFGKPTVLGVAVLPSVFEDKTGTNKDGTFANGYAALKETEHLMKLGAPESRFFPEKGLTFHYNPSDPTKTRVFDKPFEFLYLIDRPESMSVREIEKSAGDGLYLQLYSPLFKEQAGDYDNYTQHQRFLVPHDFEGKNIPGFTSFYGSFGAAVLHVPVDGLVEYCSHAASLRILRETFVGSIPASEEYDVLRQNDGTFHQVTLTDAEDAVPVKASEIGLQGNDDQATLRDRLFQKRIRLLASAETDANKRGRYRAMFLHGHTLGNVPNNMGRVQVAAKKDDADEANLKKGNLNVSITHVVGRSLYRPSVDKRPGLLEEAIKAAGRKYDTAKTENSISGDKVTGAHIQSLVSGDEDAMLQAGMAVLKSGTGVGGNEPRYGFDVLERLDFLSAKMTPEVPLAAKRYAVLSLRDELLPYAGGGEKSSTAAADEETLTANKPYSPKEAEEHRTSMLDKAKDRVVGRLQKEFDDRLKKVVAELNKTAKVYRELESGLIDLEPRKVAQIEKLRTRGDETANMYVLDAEALQMESGRRLWDFFYEDQVSPIQDLSLGRNRVLAELVNGTIRELANNSGAKLSGSVAENLYAAIYKVVAGYLDIRLKGDPRNAEKGARDGLTLVEALEREIAYRALYLSNRDLVDSGRDGAIASLIAGYHGTRKEVSLKDPVHADYLRDKVKRVVKEKSDLLCYLDAKHLQQGGIRPDRVFLVAMHKDLQDGPINDSLKGTGVDAPKAIDGWDSLREVVFYRAILNVPLFVFGRMGELRSYYHRFKSLTRRSKVLHIDKTWEDSLDDLDPVVKEGDYRQRQLREHIIDFASLLVFKAEGDAEARIVRRDGVYQLRQPPGDAAADDEFANVEAALGTTIAEAVRRLPEVLAEQSVRFGAYGQLLESVRAGMAPAILKEVASLPLKWKRNVEDLRNRYGAKANEDQTARIRDYEDGAGRLHEALEALFEQLNDARIERETTQDSSGIVRDFEAHVDKKLVPKILDTSIKLLEQSIEAWKTPKAGPRGGWDYLFKSVSEKDLAGLLSGDKTGGAPRAKA